MTTDGPASDGRRSRPPSVRGYAGEVARGPGIASAGKGSVQVRQAERPASKGPVSARLRFCKSQARGAPGQQEDAAAAGLCQKLCRETADGGLGAASPGQGLIQVGQADGPAKQRPPCAGGFAGDKRAGAREQPASAKARFKGRGSAARGPGATSPTSRASEERGR